MSASFAKRNKISSIYNFIFSKKNSFQERGKNKCHFRLNAYSSYIGIWVTEMCICQNNKCIQFMHFVA